MAEQLVTLDADLFDRRDPHRPPVFVASKGSQVPKSVLEKLGVSAPAEKARREELVEDKAVKPAETKKPRAKKAE